MANQHRDENVRVLDGSEGTEYYRLLALRGALRLELKGMKRRGRSAYSIAKQVYGLKGTRQSVLDQLTAMVEERIAAPR